MTSAFHVLFTKGSCNYLSMKQSYTIGESRSISDSDDTEQQASEWLKSSIFNRDSYGERRLNFVTSGEDDDNKKPRAKHKEHRLAQQKQRRQHGDHKHVQRQRQNTTMTLQMEPMKRGNTDRRSFKNVWGDEATLTVTVKLSASMQW